MKTPPLSARFRSASQLALLNLHDALVEATIVDGDFIRLDLRHAHIHKDHPDNPHGTHQGIAPCTLQFDDVSDQRLQRFDEATRTFVPHTDATRPIEPDISEFSFVEHRDHAEVYLGGMHRVGWVEWRFRCRSAMATWSEFTGVAWYAQGP